MKYIFTKVKQNKGENGGYTESLFFTLSDFDRMKQLLDVDVLFCLPFVLHGKTYAERKASLRELAIDFQCNNDGETDVQLSTLEWYNACLFFERAGKRYGLLTEFRENCIC